MNQNSMDICRSMKMARKPRVTELGDLAEVKGWVMHGTTDLLTDSKKNRWVLTMAGMQYMSSAIIDEPEQRGYLQYSS